MPICNRSTKENIAYATKYSLILHLYLEWPTQTGQRLMGVGRGLTQVDLGVRGSEHVRSVRNMLRTRPCSERWSFTPNPNVREPKSLSR
jgi:hypothetical protein